MKVNNVADNVQFINKIADNKVKAKEFSFSNFLSEAIDKVDNAEKVSNAFDEKLASGNIENIHSAMIAAQKAEITLNFAMEVRTKVIEAYKELTRIQI